MPSDDLLTTAQAARQLGVGARTLARWAQEGTLQPDLIAPGGHYRWNVERVREHLRERHQTREAGPPFAGELADAPRHSHEPT